jgi:hypothetical protein
MMETRNTGKTTITENKLGGNIISSLLAFSSGAAAWALLRK